MTPLKQSQDENETISVATSADYDLLKKSAIISLLYTFLANYSVTFVS